MGKFTIEIASVPDRDELVAEVWHEDEQIAEVRKDGGELRIQIYPMRGKAPWDLSFDQFLDALRQAKQELIA